MIKTGSTQKHPSSTLTHTHIIMTSPRPQGTQKSHTISICTIKTPVYYKRTTHSSAQLHFKGRCPHIMQKYIFTGIKRVHNYVTIPNVLTSNLTVFDTIIPFSESVTRVDVCTFAEMVNCYYYM